MRYPRPCYLPRVPVAKVQVIAFITPRPFFAEARWEAYNTCLSTNRVL